MVTPTHQRYPRRQLQLCPEPHRLHWVGDNGNDGVCADVDCNDNDPNITTQPGQACSDGDPTAINDLINANCSCAGIPKFACTGVGDNDGDGVCADVELQRQRPTSPRNRSR